MTKRDKSSAHILAQLHRDNPAAAKAMMMQMDDKIEPSDQPQGCSRVGFYLPYPPSVNTIWRNVVIGGRPRTLLSAKGREYRDQVIREIAKFGTGMHKFTGELRVSILLSPPDRRRRDIDNPIKPILDALTHAGVWGDDSQVKSLEIVMMGVTKGGTAHVTVETLNAKDEA